MEILVAPNSFKECASSVKISSLINSALTKVFQPGNKDFTVFEKPISDGGDGFLEVIKLSRDIKSRFYEISKPHVNELFFCETAYDEINKIIYIESASVLGMRIIPIDKRNPIEINSKNLGELIEKIISDVNSKKIELKKIIIGIGGTATNDLGAGTASVFGLKLFDGLGNIIEPIPKYFCAVEKINWTKPELPFEIEIVIDVNNPLVGENGATKIFSPQKGASDEDVEIMEKGFNNILEKMCIDEKMKCRLPGAGGGLAAGFELFFDANVVRSKDFINECLGFHSKNSNFDFVITGEGILDSQSIFEKGSFIIADHFSKKGIPVYIICWDSLIKFFDEKNIRIIRLKDFFAAKEESINKIEEGILKSVEKIYSDFFSSK